MRSTPFLALLATSLLSTANAAVVLYCPAPEVPPFRLTREAANVTIDGSIAKTRVDLVFANDSPSVQEGIFIVPIPKDAQVSDFSIMMDGKKISAETLPRGEATKVYEEIVRRMRDPGLLEHLDDQTFRARIYPIPANGTMSVGIEFIQTLTRQGGLIEYRYPGMRGGGTGGETELSLTVTTPTKIGALFSTTHDVGISRADDGKSATVTRQLEPEALTQFTLYFGEESRRAGVNLFAYRPNADKPGNFLLAVDPPRTGELSKQTSKDVVFVLDTSGSMSEEDKFGKAIKALSQCLRALDAKDRFSVVAFDTSVKSLDENLRDASKKNVEDAIEWLEQLRPRGGTNIGGATTAAYKILDATKGEDRLRQVIFMTDGQPTVGLTDEVQIVDLIPHGSGESRRMFTMGFGSDVNAPLLDQMASRTGAYGTYVLETKNLELVVGGLFDAISSPVLANVEIEIKGVTIEDRFPQELPALYAGKDTLIAGEYRGKGGPAEVTLRGISNGKKYEEKFQVEFPKETDRKSDAIRAIYANRKVAYLLDQVRKNGESKEVVDEIISLATEFQLVTPYTSMLAAPDQEYARAMSSGSSGPRNGRAFLDLRYDPTNGTISRGDIVRGLHDPDGFAAPMDEALSRKEALREKSGEDSVRMSQSLGMMREASVAAPAQRSLATALESEGSAKGNVTYAKIIDGVRFTKTDAESSWIQDGGADAKDVVKIKYLSPAYFALIERHRETKERIILGEKVRLLIGKTWVEIGEDGEADALPEGLR